MFFFLHFHKHYLDIFVENDQLVLSTGPKPEFENLPSGFDELFFLSKINSSNSLFTIILGDVNARSSSW